MSNTAQQKDYAVMIDYARTPFTKASAVPTKTGTLRDLMSEDEYKAKVDDLVKKGVHALDVHALYNMPFRTPKPTKENKVGAMSHVDPLDMAAKIVGDVVERTLTARGINASEIKGVYFGCVHQEGPQGLNIARNIVLHPDSKLPQSIPGISIDMFCASSGETISICKDKIENSNGHINLLIAGGTQSMSQIAMGGNNSYINPRIYDGNAKAYMNMGVTAENLVALYGVTRKEQEEFALRSHQKTVAAREKGYFKNEIIPVVEGLNNDDCVRTDANLAQMAAMKTVFKDARQGGTVTAATSSPTTDGASVALMSSESYAVQNNLPILCRIVSVASVGCAPEIMGIGPVESGNEALRMAGLTMADMDVVDINEAFCGQVLSCLKEWEKQGTPVDMNKLNIDGGATAIGHPLAASFTRLAGHGARILQRTGKRYALVAACIGGGQGEAMVIENPYYGRPQL